LKFSVQTCPTILDTDYKLKYMNGIKFGNNKTTVLVKQMISKKFSQQE